jgi:triosephosphate isomerase
VNRKRLLANWKMNLTLDQAAEWTRRVVAALPPPEEVSAMVLPSFTALDAVRRARGDAPLLIGAQDGYPQGHGAVTGEVGIEQLKDAGVSAVLAGHSERRRLLGEPDPLVAKKVEAYVGAGLTAVLCVGETEAERQAGHAEAVLRRQIATGLEPVAESALCQVLVAYEPVWAIGTGHPATPDAASEAAETIRAAVRARFGEERADALEILYGGSVDVTNLAGFLAASGIDGALVGGASLDADGFVAMMKAARG